MDQIKIGQFIASLRREQGMTQQEMADRLRISPKTVSKWECGKGLPELSIMLELCELFSITVNELLSGMRLDEPGFRQKAEENMARLYQERAESRKRIILSASVCVLTILSGTVILLLTGLPDMAAWTQASLIGIALAVIAGGIAVACVLDRDAGTFECPSCGARFVPTMAAYVGGVHTLTKRKLQCPVCGKKGWCRKRLTR